MQRRRRLIIEVSLATTILAIAWPGLAWHQEGHSAIATAGVRSAAGRLPGFMADGAATVAHMSVDPDLWKNGAALQAARATGPDHYIDLELLEGRALPATRYEYLRLLDRLGVDPEKIGMLPYAIAETTQKLMVGLAEHRRWPDNLHIRSKCLIYAGELAHYVGDLAQPLHTTIHWDGRTGADGVSPRTGIHTKVDGLLHWLDAESLLIDGAELDASGDLMEMIAAMLWESHGQVDRVYALEAALPEKKGPTPLDADVEQFARDAGRRGARYFATLLIYAWETSAVVEVPPWIDRAAMDGE